MSALHQPVRLVPALLGLALAVAPGWAAAAGPAPDVRVARVEGPITALTADYLDRALAEAEREGADALLVTVNTPGGSIESMLAITARLLNARVPVIAWVGPQGAGAASAGTFVVLAAHAAGMARRTTIGAASPVGAAGEDLPATMARKATEDLTATARGLAERRGPKAAAWAERAVREAVAAPADEALALGLVDAVADEPAALLEALDGREVEVGGERRPLRTAGAVLTEVPMTAGENLLGRLAHPAIALILLTIGLNALLIELSNPGGFVAGTVGVLALAVGFYSLGVLEANLIGLVFLGAAFALFLLDVNSPTHGLLMAAGIGVFVVGAVILFSGGYYGVPWETIGVLAVASAVFFAFVVRAALRAMRRPVVTGAEMLIGRTAEVRRDLAPRGKVFLLGELWDARLEGDGVAPAGTRVRVVGREGYTLVVRAEAGGAA